MRSISLISFLVGCAPSAGPGADAHTWDAGEHEVHERSAPSSGHDLSASVEDSAGDDTASEEATPATCQEILDADPTSIDGAYTLYVDGDPSRPWSAWCHDMDAAPAEYLVLAQTGSGYNLGQYRAGGAVSGVTVTTRYTRLRLDPETLLVDISDQTFSTSVGSLVHGGTTVTSMPFAVAMSCDGTASAAANINLLDTPFAVADDFVTDGWLPVGRSTSLEDGQIVRIRGGGSCGWNMPSPSVYNPCNDAGDFQLQLEYLE